MKVIKNLVIIITLVATVFAFSGCGNDENSAKEKSKKSENSEVNEISEGSTKSHATSNHKKNPVVTMNVEYVSENGETKQGKIVMELFANESPETVSNFVNLVQNGFYDGLTFHRIIDNFMIQAGDKNGDGTGSASVSDVDKSVKPGSEEDYPYSIKGEFKMNGVDNGLKYEAGTLAMARADYSFLGMEKEGYDSGSSQFFITNTDSESVCNNLQGLYAIFGKVIEGYDVVLEISKTKVAASDGESEESKPETPPVIKSMTVDTFGETYGIPALIDSRTVELKVQEAYAELMQQYYGQ